MTTGVVGSYVLRILLSGDMGTHVCEIEFLAERDIDHSIAGDA